MSRVRRAAGVVLLVSVLVALGLPRPADAAPVAPLVAVGVDPVLQARLAGMSPDDTVAVFARLRSRPSLAGLTDRDRRVRARRVQALLRAHADATQQDIRATLERLAATGQVSGVRVWWVDNALSFTATAAAVREVAALPPIALVSLDDAGIVPAAAPQGAPARAAAPGITTTRAPELWARGITGGSVVVADLDTGVDGTQPDLAGSWRGGSSGWFDPYGQHPTPTDVNGHGTWTTSVMVGRDGSGQAVGMAPDARWIAARVFDDSGRATLSAVHAAFQWVLDPGGTPQSPNPPQVLNASWSSASTTCSTEFQPDLAALRAVGIVPVFAAGNSGPATGSGTSPATLPEALAVGSVDAADVVDTTSSRGPTSCVGRSHFPDLVAPGVDIAVDDLYGGSWTASGTSLAAPHVAGALALLLSAHPGTSAADQQAALAVGAKDLGAAGPDDVYGAGRLDVVAAEAALVPSAPTGPVTSAVTVTPNPVGGAAVPMVAASISAGAGGGVPVSARASVDGGPAQNLGVTTGATSASASGPLSGTLVDGSHTVAVSAADAVGTWGAAASATFVVDRTTPSLSAPAVTPTPTAGATGVTVTASATDAVTGVASAEAWLDGDPGSGRGTAMTVTTVAGSSTLRTVLPTAGWSPGTHTISVRAVDGAGNLSLASTGLSVSAAPPTSFADGFETGNLSAWTATSGGGLSVTTTAALAGRYGLAVSATRTGGAVRATVPGSSGPFDVRVLLDPRAMATGSAVVPLLVENAPAGPAASLEYRLSAGSAQIRASGRTGTGAAKPGAWVAIANTGTSVVELDAQPASGTLTLYVADGPKYILSGLATNRVPSSVDLGLVGTQPTSVVGGVRLDAFAVSRTAHIGTGTAGL